MCLLKDWVAPVYFKDALRHAAVNGQLAAMRLLKEWGATCYNDALCAAALHGNVEAMCLAREWGADDFNKALGSATHGLNLEVMRLLKEWGANDFRGALNRLFGDDEVEDEAADLLIKWIDEDEK